MFSQVSPHLFWFFLVCNIWQKWQPWKISKMLETFYPLNLKWNEWIVSEFERFNVKDNVVSEGMPKWWQEKRFCKCLKRLGVLFLWTPKGQVFLWVPKEVGSFKEALCLKEYQKSLTLHVGNWLASKHQSWRHWRLRHKLVGGHELWRHWRLHQKLTCKHQPWKCWR